MKLNYVSILKKHPSKKSGEGYLIRGELEKTPSSLWFMKFQLLWLSTPSYTKLCSMPQLKNNAIILSLFDRENITACLDALKEAVSIMSQPNSTAKSTYQYCLHYLPVGVKAIME
jgi:hypothetical protein